MCQCCFGTVPAVDMMFGHSDEKGVTRKADCKLSPDIPSESLEWLVLERKEAHPERAVPKISVTVGFLPFEDHIKCYFQAVFPLCIRGKAKTIVVLLESCHISLQFFICSQCI